MAEFEEEKKSINDYISNNLKDISTSYLANDSLNKFCRFLADKPIELITDVNMIIENPNLQRLLSAFFNHNKSLITEGSLEQFFDDPILLQLIDNYCTVYNIDLSKYSAQSEGKKLPEDSMSILLADISKYPVLSHEQTIEAFKDYENNVSGAFEKLVNCNLRLVLSVAKKYVNHGMDLLDLFQEGSIGLMEAVKRYDYKRGTRFSTYATWWIRQSISREMANKVETIRLPVHLVEGTNKVIKACNVLAVELDREPTNEEISNYTGYTISEVEKLKKLIYTSKNLISLNSKNLDVDKGELGDFIPSLECVDEEVETLVLKDEVLTAFKKVHLSPKEVDVIKRRFGMAPYYEPQTLQQVADYYHMTREGVRVIQNTALRRLKNYFTFVKTINVKKRADVTEIKPKLFKPRKSIYSYFSPDDYIIANAVINNLDAWDRKIINNHDNGFPTTTAENTAYYTELLPKIKKQVAALSSKKWLNEIDSETLLRMLKDEQYYPLTARLSTTDSIIVFMNFGFINDKKYSISQIAGFTKISEKEVAKRLEIITSKYKAIIDKLYLEYQKNAIIVRRRKRKQ